MQDVITHTVGEDITISIIPERKFKTVSISYCFQLELNDYYTYQALLPAILKRGCEGLENIQQISEHLDQQYGALFDVGVQKKGERQVLRFSLDMVNEKYIPKNQMILAQGFYFLSRILTKPLIKEGLFIQDYVKQEKENLSNRIRGLINDKEMYAIEKCIQQMYPDERFGRYVFGNLKDLENLDQEKLVEVYHRVLKSSPLNIMVVGDVDPEKIKIYVENSLQLNRGSIHSFKHSPRNVYNSQINIIHETMDTSQGKLIIGCRTNTVYTNHEYYALVVYASILGGGPYSMLFQNVREKEKLAYYTYTVLEKYQGLMLISAGIESIHFDNALEVIMHQHKNITEGDFEDEKLRSAKLDIITSMKGLMDQPYQIMDYYLDNVMGEIHTTIHDYIKHISNVTMEDIIQISGKIKFDTVYFLSHEKRRPVELEKHTGV